MEIGLNEVCDRDTNITGRQLKEKFVLLKFSGVGAIMEMVI